MSEQIFTNTLIFLGAAIIMVPLVRKLGFSSVIGYILGGIIIGPFVLKLTGNADDVMHATEFGVVMLLFIVGLELEPKKFWSMRRTILGLGGMQMLATTAFLFLIFFWTGWYYKTAITMALCFALSSTAIVLQTLKEKNLFNTASGEASFSILLLQDIAVIPILAFLPWIANPDIDQVNHSALLINMLPNWMKPFSVLIGVGILIILGRYIFVPFLRYVSSSGMNELLTATSLFLVVGVSHLMTLIGLSPALGAFLAGVMLANSEFRHELESNINPFRGLLLAVFFVSVGSTINFNVIKDDPLFIFSVVAIILVVKFAVLFCIGKIFKMSMEQNLLMSLGLSQVGEFALVLLSFSTKLYLINEELNSQLMAVVAITMCITPILLLINEKLIDPYFNVKVSDDPHQNHGMFGENKIIIVGYGHFGSTVGRLLKVNGFQATILDHDSDRVSMLRDNGLKVFYGDATRTELLRVAGAEKAEILVLCLDSPEDNYTIIQIVRKQFPHLKIFVRARNRLDNYDFLNKGVENIYRETLGTAVNMGVDILQAAGMRRYAARRIGHRFEIIDKLSTRRLAKERLKESPTFTIKEALEREAELLKDDNISFDDQHWVDIES
ncbi:potassium transporter [Elizabethkingia anophelis]|uniref:monovalent cation:proton antiporter-2 (CPA2) family protein n=1 Tax=Elizabethkingia anophelis TaxID=1117645 RepID=UPI000CE98D51|nr:monovalent cation:proton antiporter-2 (CPA2) family protein [Elizabethkingia anophelis]AVF47961.1 potassium transporter [Elizabethkingia anophelis]AVF51953.1 potassium transporter [Elizabethkingia anophelis]MBG0505563.1 cation:proton antiporter [Elizabethkingia anophelis]MCT4074752.1 cation:proton antiporter [Elizabethkingia anophelis]MDV3902134.1 potassium transporter [Elizabethkingia anophelis]